MRKTDRRRSSKFGQHYNSMAIPSVYSDNTTVGVNKVTGVTESFPSNLNRFWKNILHV